MEDLSGRIIKGYELTALIGEGGFGAVYLASQRLISREVAVKIILPEHANQPDFVRRFETEAQLIARLEHPHIVPLYDYWRDPAGAFLVMRYLRGGSLHDSLAAEGPWQPDRIASMITQISSALAVAHRQGVIHRDLKPENILLDEMGNAYLTDFGIAKDTVSQESITQNNAIIGSPAYISPEQIRGEAVTPMSDLYALGFLIYEMLTGKHPFEGITATALMYKHLTEPIPSVREIRPELSGVIDTVLQRATAKDLTNRYQDVMELASHFRRAVRVGDAEDEHDTLFITRTTDTIPEPENPYKGLRAFQQADASDFFGRENLIESLLEQLEEEIPERNFLAVVGPSGSGKSSVVKAGLIPALHQGKLPGSEEWFIVEMVPGIDPMEELEAALLRIAVNPPESLLTQLNEDERGLMRAAKRILPDSDSQLLIVIDQFEELFTLVDEEEIREHFMNSLIAAVMTPRSPVKVIITLRADFYDRPLYYGKFGELIQKRTEVVLPLNTNETERAVVGPAERAGLILERGLVTAIVTDVNEQPGALPLLQYALTELYERKEGKTLTLAAYEEIGGTMGALARRAQELYDGLDEEGQEAARQMFLRLVTLGEGTEDTRRRVMRSELASLGDPDAMEMVLDAFGRYRLLTFDHDPQTRSSTVEVAHEALIRQWSELREWLEDSREDLRIQRRLSQAAEEWQHSAKDDSFLARGSRLTQFEETVSQGNIALNTEEQEYLNISIQRREERIREEQEREERERQRDIRDRNRLRMFVGVLAVATIISILFLIVAILESQEAQKAREIAEDQGEQTQALALSANARNVFIESNPVLALSLALEADSTYSPSPVEVQRTLSTIAYAPAPRYKITDHEATVMDADFSPDDLQFVSASVDGTLRQWNMQNGELIQVFGTDGEFYTSVAYSPDGTVIASGDTLTIERNENEDGSIRRTYAGRVRLWDSETGELIREFTNGEYTHADAVSDITFNADGSLLLSGSLDRTMILWDVQTGDIVKEFSGTEEDPIGAISSVAISSDGSLIVSGHVDQTIYNITSDYMDRSIRVWDVESGEVLKQYEPNTGFVRSVDISLNNRFVASASWSNASGGGLIHIWDIRADTNDAVQILYPDGSILTSVEFSPDGEEIAVGSWGRNISIWNWRTGTLSNRITALEDRVINVTYSNDGEHILVTTGNYGNNEFGIDLEDASNPAIWVIDTQDRALLQVYEGQEDWVWEVDLDPAGDTMISAGGSFSTPINDARVLLWDVATGEILKTFGDFVNVEDADFDPADYVGHTSTVDGVVFNADATQILSGSWDTQVILWDVESTNIIRTFEGHENRVHSVDIHPDNRIGASGDRDSIVILWDLETGEEIRRFNAHNDATINHVVFSPDGTQLATSGEDNTIAIWDVETGEELQRMEGHTDGVNQIAYSHDGSLIASTSWDASVRLWDVATGAEIREFSGHESESFGIAFSPDDSTLLSGSSDQTMRMWDVETGAELYRYEGHTSWLQDIEYHPSGQFAISAAQDNTLRAWRTTRNSDEIFTYLESNRYVRDLTCAEQEQYRIELDEQCLGE